MCMYKNDELYRLCFESTFTKSFDIENDISKRNQFELIISDHSHFRATAKPALKNLKRCEESSSAFLLPFIKVVQYLLQQYLCLDFKSKDKQLWANSVINLALIGSATSFLIHSAMDIPFLSVPKDPFCDIQFGIKTITFGMTAVFSYFVLWFRVFTTFYRNDVVKQDLSKALQIVNMSIMPLFLITIVTMVILIIIEPRTIYAGCGCKPLLTREDLLIQWVGVIASSIVSQTVLLFCFVYPLCLNSKKLVNSGLDHKFIHSIIQRATIAAVFWVVSDLVNFVLGGFYIGPFIYYQYFAYTVNLLITLTVTILSFASWQDKFFPFYKKLPYNNTSFKSTTT